MLQSHHRAFHRLIVAADLVLVSGAAILSSAIPAPAWLAQPPRATHGLGLQVTLLVLAWLVASGRGKLYQSRRTQSSWRETSAVVETWFVTIAATTLISLAAWGAPAFAPFQAFGTGLLALLVLRGIVRLALRTLRREGWNFRRALLVGGGAAGRALTNAIGGRRHYGIRVLGQVTFGDETIDGLEQLGTASELREALRRNQADYVILCPPEDAQTQSIREVFEICDEAGIACHYAPHFLSLRHLHPAVAWYGDIPALAFRVRPYSLWQERVKRTIDVTGAGLALLILSPLMLALALAVKLQDGGSILFRQRRIGRMGKPFVCYKFRTMCPNAESQLSALQTHNEQDGPVFKIKNDPRTTPLGRLMRRYSLDELPQLLNVLAGSMSLVGPRPPIPEEVERYAWWQRRRISVAPGLTCIWQVSGRNRVSFEQWMTMDLYYVDNWSLWMDLKLMLRTVPAVLRGTGS